MTIVAVESIPKARKVPKNYNQDAILDEFTASSAKIAKVICDSGEYGSTWSAYQILRKFVREQKRPIKVLMRNGEVYLEKII